MKRILSLLLITCMMSACRLQYTPLKGNYPADYAVVFDKPADDIMTDIVDYCFKNNITLKTIDRKSGLVMSETYTIKTYTSENPNGTPKDSSAHAIIGGEVLTSDKDYYFEPEVIKADIIFMVKEESNQTTMTISLANMVGWVTNRSCLREIRSTGVFEKQIIEGMK